MNPLRIIRLQLSLFSVVGLAASAGGAATLANYEFTTNLAATSTDSQVTATAFSGAGTSRSSSSYAFQYPQTANSGYMQFTLTAEEGHVLDLNSLSFVYYFAQTAGTNVAVTGTFSLQYSLDGFATAGVALTSPQAAYTSISGANDASITLSDFSPGSYSLAGIPETASIGFRIMLSNDGSLNTSGYRYAIDNVVVDGAVVVPTVIPEPSSFALIAGAACVALAGLRRRR